MPLLAVLTLLGASPCADSPPRDASIAEWSRNSVQISGDRTGLGLVVGWEAGRAWIAAPRHVVLADLSKQALARARESTTVRFTGDDNARLSCPELPNDSPLRPQFDVDLAFVCVPWNGFPVFNTGLAARVVRQGDEIRLAGARVVGEVSGKWSAGDSPEGETEVEGLAGIQGLSGALVVNRAGVVGLYLGRTNGGRLLPLAVVRRHAALARVPWGLQDSEFFDCAKKRRICVRAAAAIAPEAVELRSLLGEGAAVVAPGACADLPEGKYQVSVPGDDPSCEPKNTLVLSGAGALDLTLTCTPHLGGTWVDASGDSLLCVDGDPGIAQCSGLPGLGVGLLVARLQTSGRTISILGAFQPGDGSSRVASGNFQWTRGRLTGALQRAGDPPRRVSLRRKDAQ
jgi:hypothetical protein